MTKTECGFCEDQKRGRIVKSSHKIEALKQSDQLFICRLKGRDDTAATTFQVSESANEPMCIFSNFICMLIE